MGEQLDTNGYYALGLPLYLAVLAVEIVWTRRRGVADHGFGDTVSNVSGGLGEVVLGLFLGPHLVALYDWAFETARLVTWGDSWGERIASWIVALFAADFCYYAYHRVGHRVALFWAIHGVHHQSERFNVTVALRHPWLSDVYSWPFYALLPLLGVPAFQFFVAITIISFYGLTIHSRTFHRPSLFLFVTPASHIVHHARNRRYLGMNLGAMFTLWDRMFGTHRELHPDDPPLIGTSAGYRTHDGARAQWILFVDLLRAARAANGWRERLRVIFGPPGRRPPGYIPMTEPPARSDEAIPRATKVYVGAQLGLTIATAAYVLWLRDQHSPIFLVGAAAACIITLKTLGGMLDASARAAQLELARNVGVALFAPILFAVGEPVHAALALAWALLGLAWVGSRALEPATA